ncbi:MAG: hypothetical protein D6729_15210 [Deltaproteobacteria bacterium]|nr:MAG: hypothetical protein D6729_15210 [Deltaproteobacteria bacterium]
MRIHILFHDRCFDGMASAGLFEVFYRTKVDRSAEVSFGGLEHGPGPGRLCPERLEGDENAVLDFRYLPDERLTWWFDHHRTGFKSAEDRVHFETDTSGRKYFDPNASSCASLMVRQLARHHGFDPSPYREVLAWADRIDTARFETPEAAVSLETAPMRLLAWIEHSHSLEERVVVLRHLVREGVEAAAGLPLVRRQLEPVLAAHRETVAAFRRRCRLEGSVAFCDLTDLSLKSVNKFLAYYLFPEAPYAVVVTRNGRSSRVSVGFSPWRDRRELRHDIARLCHRYGGGGHSVVGGIDFHADAADEAVRVAREVVATLNRS